MQPNAKDNNISRLYFSFDLIEPLTTLLVTELRGLFNIDLKAHLDLKILYSKLFLLQNYYFEAKQRYIQSI